MPAVVLGDFNRRFSIAGDDMWADTRSLGIEDAPDRLIRNSGWRCALA
jgi:hypothetical protein